MHVLAIIGRVVAGCVAALAFYMAFFLYEDEEGVWQNRLNKLWMALDDRAKLTNSKATALFNKIAEIQNNAYRRVFGARLLSAQSIGVSTSYCRIVVWNAMIAPWPKRAHGRVLVNVR